MNTNEFTKLKQRLGVRGYRHCFSYHTNEDYSYAKSFGHGENQYDPNRCCYQIFYMVWDKRVYGADDVGVAVRISVSRTIDERIDLELLVDENTIIKDIENQAASFYDWCERNIKPK